MHKTSFLGKYSNIFAYITFLIILFFGSPACKVRKYINFQVLQPGKITIPADVKTLAFVDRNVHFIMDTLKNYYSYNNELFKDSIPLDTVITASCYNGFIDNLSEYLLQDSIPFVQLGSMVNEDSVHKFPPLSWLLVDSICAANGSDILVVLEGARVANKYTVDGDVREGFYGYNDINYWAVWRIYDPLYQKYYDEYLQTDSMFLEVYSNSYRDLVNYKLPDRKSTFMDAGYTIGQAYAKRISPQWNDVQRTYYCAGDKRLEAACYFISQDNWNKAIQLLEAVTQGEKNKPAGRAAFNLALAYEVKGDLKQAIGWIRKSIYFYKQMDKPTKETKLAELYSLILAERRKGEQQLKIFFGE